MYLFGENIQIAFNYLRCFTRQIARKNLNRVEKNFFSLIVQFRLVFFCLYSFLMALSFGLALLLKKFS